MKWIDKLKPSAYTATVNHHVSFDHPDLFYQSNLYVLYKLDTRVMIVGGSRKTNEVKAEVDAMDKGKDIQKRLNDDHTKSMGCTRLGQ
jgi:hypothetical protein